MDNVYKLLMEIRRRPELYLGKPSLDRLYAFINGYKQCENEEGIQSVCLDGFQNYIEEKYDMHTDHNWASIIQFFNSSEDEAFYAFYNHLDNYLNTEDGRLLQNSSNHT